jgi:hypothetical protein
VARPTFVVGLAMLALLCERDSHGTFILLR